MVLAEGTRIKTFKRATIPKQTKTRPAERHPFEIYLEKGGVRWLLKALVANQNGFTPMEKLLTSYLNPHANLSHRLEYWPVHRMIDLLGYPSSPSFRKMSKKDASYFCSG